jgi:hypothetical protein
MPSFSALVLVDEKCMKQIISQDLNQHYFGDIIQRIIHQYTVAYLSPEDRPPSVSS